MTPAKGTDRPLTWFQFDAQGWVSDPKKTILSLAARGAYITLCAWQWLEGSIPDDVNELARLCNVRPRSFAKVWSDELEPLFPKTRGKRRANRALGSARRSALNRYQKLSAAGRKGGKRSRRKAVEDKPGLSQDALRASYSSSKEVDSGMKVEDKGVDEVFQHWETQRHIALRLTRAVPMKPTQKRLGKIRARLSEGYTVDDLKEAIEGCMASKFHRDGHHVDIELICRDQEHVERFRSKRPKPRKKSGLDHLGG